MTDNARELLEDLKTLTNKVLLDLVAENEELEQLQKKGEWIPKERLTDCSLYIDIVCSKCGYVGFECYAYGYELNEIDMKKVRDFTKDLDMNFCPCCGAKMDKGGE